MKRPVDLPPSSAAAGNRRSAVVRAAGRLFREKGYAATTIRDIAQAAGMRSGSPFYHFRTKHDMLHAVVLEGLAAVHTAVALELNAGHPPRQTFEAMLRAHLHQVLGEEGRDFSAVLLHESRHLEPSALAEVIALKDAYEAMWQNALKILKRAGLVADDSKAARLFLLGAMNWTTLWYRTGGPLSVERLARKLANFVLREPDKP
ncbi:MAG: TetR/AcrR family transcriptional regulator [Rugosibacter sp.]|nr:TetR/AcrR family transcriptional regulator [Rugosibacter sp.]